MCQNCKGCTMAHTHYGRPGEPIRCPDCPDHGREAGHQLATDRERRRNGRHRVVCSCGWVSLWGSEVLTNARARRHLSAVRAMLG